MEKDNSSVSPAPTFYSIEWKPRDKTIFNMFKNFLATGFMTDMILSTGNKSLRCHKLVLAAASNYFEEMIRDSEQQILGGSSSYGHNWNSAVVIRDATFQDLEAVITYIYEGKVVLEGGRISGFLKAAESLKVKGIVPPFPEKESRAKELGVVDDTSSKTADLNQLDIEGDGVKDLDVVMNRVDNSSINHPPFVRAVTVPEIKNANQVDFQDKKDRIRAKGQKKPTGGEGVLLQTEQKGKRTKARDNKTKKYKLYNNDNISTALDYINHHGISCEKAAELHGIPYRTLARHHRSQQTKRNEPDSKTAEVLTPQKRRSTRVSSQTTESCDASQQSDLEDGVDESNSKRHKS